MCSIEATQLGIGPTNGRSSLGLAALHNRVAGAAFGGHRVVGKSSVWCGWSRGRTVVVWIVVDLGFAFVLVSQ